MAGIRDLIKAINNVNKIPDGSDHACTYTEALGLLTDGFGLSLSDEDMEIAITRVDEFAFQLAKLRKRHASQPETQGAMTGRDVYTGNTTSHGTTVDGVLIPGPRRNALAGNRAHRPVEKIVMAKEGKG